MKLGCQALALAWHKTRSCAAADECAVPFAEAGIRELVAALAQALVRAALVAAAFASAPASLAGTGARRAEGFGEPCEHDTHLTGFVVDADVERLGALELQQVQQETGAVVP